MIEPLKAGRSLAPIPRINLALPADASGETDTKTLVDLTDSPWSGARVRYQIVVKDEAGQEGRTKDTEITLPARPFRDPLARALAEDRRRLVTAPDSDGSGSRAPSMRSSSRPTCSRRSRRCSSVSGPPRSACARPRPMPT